MLAALGLAAALAVPTTISPAGATTSTFDRAYHSARANAIVKVLPGHYPPQTLTPGGHRVIFAPAGGAVSVGEVHVNGATNVEFRDMAMDGWTVASGNGITFRRIRTTSFYIYAPASRISVIGGSVGPSRNFNSYIAVPSDAVAQPSRHLLIDGVRFHDVSRDPPEHVECLMLAQGEDVVIRNSTFTNCSVFDLFVTWWYFRPKVGPPTNVRISNNRFGKTTDGFFSMQWADYVNQAGLPWSGFTVTGNRCGQRADYGGTTKHVSFTVSRNPGC